MKEIISFILIKLSKQETVIEKARSYLESNVNSFNSDEYVLPLVTYALHTSNSDMKDQAFDLMKDLKIDG